MALDHTPGEAFVDGSAFLRLRRVSLYAHAHEGCRQGAYPGVGATLTSDSGRSPSSQGPIAPPASANSTSATTARTAPSDVRARCSTCARAPRPSEKRTPRPITYAKVLAPMAGV